MNQLNLRIECDNIPKLDVFTQSDPFVEVFEIVVKDGKKVLKEVGFTETIPNNKNPKFQKDIVVDFIPSRDKELCFKVYDEDGDSEKLKDHDFIGQAVMKLSEILNQNGNEPLLNKKNKIVKSKNKTAIIRVSAAPVVKSDWVITLRLKADNLKKMDMFGSTPYYQILKKVNNKWEVTYKSNYIKRTTNPVWNQDVWKSSRLCDNDDSKSLLFQCMNKEKFSKSSLIGEFYFTAKEIKPSAKFALHKDATKPSSSDKNLGEIEIMKMTKTAELNIENLCKSGTEFNTIIVIDFSASSELNAHVRTLHNVNAFNEFEGALRSCGNAMKIVDSDQLFPVWGFSAQRGPNISDLSSCFSLTFDHNVSHVQGIDSVIDLYRNTLDRIEFGQSKVFNEVFETTRVLVERHLLVKPNSYFVLFIFVSDGIIEEIELLKDYIVTFSRMPISIIFVGVGDGSFGVFGFLDQGWKNITNKSGIRCSRDSVSLIKFRDLCKSGTNVQVSDDLAQFVYKTINKQVTEYFKEKIQEEKSIKGVVGTSEIYNMGASFANLELKASQSQIQNEQEPRHDEKEQNSYPNIHSRDELSENKGEGE